MFTDTLFSSLPEEMKLYLRNFRQNPQPNKPLITFLGINEDMKPYELSRKINGKSYPVLLSEDVAPEGFGHLYFTLRKMKQKTGFIAIACEVHYDQPSIKVENGLITISTIERDGQVYEMSYDLSKSQLNKAQVQVFLFNRLARRWKTQFFISELEYTERTEQIMAEIEKMMTDGKNGVITIGAAPTEFITVTETTDKKKKK